MKNQENEQNYDGMPFITWVRVPGSNEGETIINVHLLLEVPNGLEFNEPKKDENGNYTINLSTNENSEGKSCCFIIADFNNEISAEFTISVLKDSDPWYSVKIGEISAADAESIVVPEHVAAPFVFPEVNDTGGNHLSKVHTTVILPDNATHDEGFQLTTNPGPGYKKNVEWDGEASQTLNLHRSHHHVPTYGLDNTKIPFTVIANGKKKKVLVSTSDGIVGDPK